jgi:hypothetical protein
LRAISLALSFTLGGSSRFCGLCGSVAAFAIMVLVVRSALSISGLINEASGRFRQYLRGISFCMACTFSRAGLKMLA